MRRFSARARSRALPAIVCGLWLLVAPGCSGQRSDGLSNDINSAAKADAGTPTTPAIPEPPIPTQPTPGAPARHAGLGVTTGQVQSAHYRARVAMSFPSQTSPSSAAPGRLTLVPGGSQ